MTVPRMNPIGLLGLWAKLSRFHPEVYILETADDKIWMEQALGIRN